MPLVPFKLLPLCWSPEVVSLCKSKSVWGPLKGDSWESHSFFHHSNLHRFLQTNYEDLPSQWVLEPWAGWSGLGLGSLTSEVSPWFLSTTHGCGTADSMPLHISLSLLPIWMNVASLNPWFSDLHTFQFSDKSGWYLFCSHNFCCSCVRRQGVFTYASFHLDQKFVKYFFSISWYYHQVFLFQFVNMESLLTDNENQAKLEFPG